MLDAAVNGSSCPVVMFRHRRARNGHRRAPLVTLIPPEAPGTRAIS